MRKVGVAILGLGVVGGGTARILINRKQAIKEEYGVDIDITAVLDRIPERVTNLGLDLNILASSIDEITQNPNVDIVVECMGGTETARTFLVKSLEAGKSIVTSNKEMFAKFWPEL